MSGAEHYARDMVGYGKTTPAACWPNNARVAVQFVLNYEEGGENCILHGDKTSEWLLSEIVGAAPLPGMIDLLGKVSSHSQSFSCVQGFAT